MLIFIDVETTGLEYEDKICSIAILYENQHKYELINEGKKIHAQASSVHHLTNEMIKGKPLFKDTQTYELLQKLNSGENVLMAHNANFVLEKLTNAGISWMGEVIDTLRVTRHLISECDFFSLQVLRYELKLYRSEEQVKLKYGIKDAIVAHNSLSDALVVELLFDYLKELASEEKMKELSLKNVLIQIFTFGKHKGKSIEEVCLNDRSYVEWLKIAIEMDEDMRYSIDYYLKG